MGVTVEHIIKTIQENDLQKAFFCSDYWDNYEDELEEFYPEDYDGGYEEFEKVVAAYLESKGMPTEYVVVDERCDTSEFWAVVHFPVEDIYIKITGWYDSYGGYEHEYHKEITQVFPKQVTATIYESK